MEIRSSFSENKIDYFFHKHGMLIIELQTRER